MVGASDADHIWLLGHDLADELLGRVTFGELAYWMVAKRRPTEGQRVLFEAVLVALADHGFTRPRPRSPRVTYLSAPDSCQRAIVAGLLGGGSRFLGVTEDAANLLNAALATLDATPDGEAGWDEVAMGLVADSKVAGRVVPGLGHPVHKVRDPGTPMPFRRRGSMRCSDLISRCSRRSGGSLRRSSAAPCRSTAPACAARSSPTSVLPLGVTRGFALLARCAGLLGQLAEELVDRIGNDIYMNVDRNTDYRPPRS